MVKHQSSVSRIEGSGVLLALLLLLAATIAIADAADETPPPADAVSPPADAVSEEPARDFEDRRVAAKRAYNTGVVMLGIILIAGVGLVAVALLWGNRARRIARQALPSVGQRDELWFLKNRPESSAQKRRDDLAIPPDDEEGQ